jgi:hypothetical protein
VSLTTGRHERQEPCVEDKYGVLHVFSNHSLRGTKYGVIIIRLQYSKQSNFSPRLRCSRNCSTDVAGMAFGTLRTGLADNPGTECNI